MFQMYRVCLAQEDELDEHTPSHEYGNVRDSLLLSIAGVSKLLGDSKKCTDRLMFSGS